MDEDHAADPVRNVPEDEPAFNPAAVGERQRDSGPSRIVVAVAADEPWPLAAGRPSTTPS